MERLVEETPDSLLQLVDNVQASLRALKVMNQPVDGWDVITVHVVVSKLPPAAQQAWCMGLRSRSVTKLADLLVFIQQRAYGLATNLVKPAAPGQQELAKRTQPRPQPVARAHMATATDNRCFHCRGAHRITRCQQFQAMSLSQRMDTVKRAGVCFNCLKRGHNSAECQSSDCRRCGRRHNTLLCTNQQSTEPRTSVDSWSSQRATGPSTSQRATGPSTSQSYKDRNHCPPDLWQ